MTLQDLLLTPIYFAIIYLFAQNFQRQVKDRTIRQYFMPALLLKLFGALALGIIYQFYYGGGDTFNFFRDSKIIWRAVMEAPIAGLQIIFSSSGDYNPDTYAYTRWIYFYQDRHSFQVIRLAGFFNILSFGTYTVTALLFAVASFSGVWAMYRVFYDLYPQLHRPFAVACFFIPSVFFWGSGLMKDTVTLGALGWLLYGFYFGLIRWQRLPVNLSIAFVALLVIQAIKVYILMAFLPGMFLWLFLQYRTRIRNRAVRTLALPFMILLSLPFGYLALIQITADNERYQFENIANTANVTSDWLNTVSQREDGSGYQLGEGWDGSLGSTASLAPRAIWLGLFQPHPWQAGFNPVMQLSAMEATLFLLITLRILLTVNLLRLYGLFFKHPILILCLSFSLILAFAVAISSANYGTMVRYRIPFMPFYLAMLYIIRYQVNKSVKIL